ncbi:TPA: hypothetical protein IAA86_00790 [Candidatus Galligastranaerophilus intestinavium]|uniref:Uncharacterized protein n=1 Tax=Candidatus Galligastranaerophilus intestinavium TaxID=2840836 RepID=A0A9D1JXD1_9BACT|nr:hypothetical protein [Candidatus Galligastranaerophilus intestinavium]
MSKARALRWRRRIIERTGARYPQEQNANRAIACCICKTLKQVQGDRRVSQGGRRVSQGDGLIK